MGAAVAKCCVWATSSSISTSSSDRLNVLIALSSAVDKDVTKEDLVLFSVKLTFDISSWRGSTVRSSTSSKLTFLLTTLDWFLSSGSYFGLPNDLFVVRIHVILLSFFVVEFLILSTFSAVRCGIVVLSGSTLEILPRKLSSTVSWTLVPETVPLRSHSNEAIVVADCCLSGTTAVFVWG